jgi:hypothetical protein
MMAFISLLSPPLFWQKAYLSLKAAIWFWSAFVSIFISWLELTHLTPQKLLSMLHPSSIQLLTSIVTIADVRNHP